MEPQGILAKRFSEELNQVQFDAVKHIQGPSLIIAGAGSGKTRVLTYRIAWLLANGVQPYRILALTFTNKAAREMKERIGSLIGDDLASNLWMGTFHSIFAKILRYEADKLGFDSAFTIYDTQDSKNLLKTIIKEKKLDDKTYRPGDVLGRISSAKNNLITADSYVSNTELASIDRQARKPEMGEIYKTYVNRCKRSNAMDFDDLLLNTNILFRDHKDVLESYQKRFDFVLVDEYQDTNFAQYLIIKKLCDTHKNICVVGDDAQSIYSFRGAKIENILNFKNDYPDHKIFKLEQNYRSTQIIVEAANSVIAKNKERIPKNVWSERKGGDKIKVFKNYNDIEEGQVIANNILDNVYAKQLQYSEQAILYRTNAQSRIFEEALRRKNIPYKVYGSISFYQRKEIKDVLSYFRLLINANDDEALKRIINYPARGIGNTTMERLEKAAQLTNKSIYNVIENINLNDYGINKGTQTKLENFYTLIKEYAQKVYTNDAYELAFAIVKQTGILTELYQSNTIEDKSRIENIEELLNGIKVFSEELGEKEELATLDKFMENVALLTDADTENKDEKNTVSLMTIHAAKGLEFDQVYIAGVEEELFPSRLSISTTKELEEERRLFYVAITRAKTNAYLSYSENRLKWGTPTFCQPSRFITEIDAKYLDMPESIFEQASNESDRSLDSVSNFFKSPSQTKQKFAKNNSTATFNSVKKSVHVPTANFKPDDPSAITEGTAVEHERFGFGKVVTLEGNMPNIKAKVYFDTLNEEKVLLLKFAKLRIVN